MDHRVKQLRLMRWKEIVVACNTSGMKKKDWLAQNNINPKSFYRKQKEIRDYELNNMELTVPTDQNAVAGRMSQEFVDMTALTWPVSNQRTAGTTGCQYGVDPMQPEMMLQVGTYQLYIGSRTTGATLKTVLEVLKNV